MKHAVHRYVWEQMVEPIEEETLDHLCFNKRCFNPDHLEPVSRSLNATRGQENNPIVLARRHATACHAGHEYTEKTMKIGKKGERICRLCAARLSREYRARKMGL